MCGIFAMLLKRPLHPADVARGRVASQALAHRGPDGSGEFVDGEAGVFLAHRRLTILDLTDASAQPFQADGAAITFNGELYNYRELRDRLAQEGAGFRTTGDTEVLLKAWLHWRGGILERADGMFAFVLWDGREGHVAVDPFGEKPLYFAEIPDGFYASSELAPLVAAIGATPKLEGAPLAAFLALGAIPAPDTAYPAIQRMPPATRLTIRQGAVVSTERYWTPPIASPGRGTPQPLSEPELDRVEAAIAGSLTTRLHADVPMCAFLSSGVDSALLVALARRVLDRAVPCITVAFRQGKAVDESAAAAAIAQHLGVPHEVLDGGNPSPDAPGEVLSLFGQPNDNITALSIRDMCRVARSRFKVGITGLGGDELFFGYRKHALAYRLRRLLALPQGLRLALAPAAQVGRAVSGKAAALADLVAVRDWEVVPAFKTAGITRWMQGQPGWSAWAQQHFPTKASVPVPLLLPRYDVLHTLHDSLLPAQDLGSMAEGLELRAPFLSRPLASLVAEFDPRSLLAFGRKSVLYRLLQRHLPLALVLSRKVGFVFPQDRFLAATGTHAPKVAALRPGAVSYAWERRQAADGWRRLCVRLALADAFQQEPKPAAGWWPAS